MMGVIIRFLMHMKNIFLACFRLIPLKRMLEVGFFMHVIMFVG